MKRIDLSCDLGEAGNPDDQHLEDQLWPMISSANVACGGHAGDDASMIHAIEMASRHGVALGAHPSYPDREGFGRRRIDIDPTLLEDSIAQQLGDLSRLAEQRGVKLRHVKPHGALYNDSMTDEALASILVRAVRRAGAHLALVALPGSIPLRLATPERLPVVREAFADRAYDSSGLLVPRSEPRSLISDFEEAADQAVAIASTRTVRSIEGKSIRIDCDTICIHSDMPGAVGRAEAIIGRLRRAGFEISPDDRLHTA
ncbi:MAG: LamB/YcsF family protein [Acidobacteria bacterium]|nr:LamB/YcsF family protein [Acidobacteriota bacterium]